MNSKAVRRDAVCSHCRAPLTDPEAWENEDSQFTERQFCSDQCALDDYFEPTEHFAGFLDPAVPAPADFAPGYVLPENRGDA